MLRIARSHLIIIIIGVLLAACAPQPEAPRLAITPFPTPTVGSVLQGALSSAANVVPQGLISPATAVAISALPTPTPDLFTCPPFSDSARLEDTPPLNAPIVIEEIVRYLNTGGAYESLSEILSERWGIVREGDSMRGDVDFTGEGTPEILITYANPDGRSAVLLLGCIQSEYRVLYELNTQITEPPQMIAFGDMNRDRRNDLLFAVQQCPTDDANNPILDECELNTRLLSWQANESRFANLLVNDVLSDTLPEINDFDNDEVSELVVRLENDGTERTGPLRTGTNIYDWNGQEYVLSIIQPDPPRYRIQVIFEADRAFLRRELGEAAQLYQVALQDPTDLRDWIGGERASLIAYTLYRLLITQVASQSASQTQTYQRILNDYPDPQAASIYVRMARAFMETYQQQGNPALGCDAVRAVLTAEADNNALELLNRYGERSPKYTLNDLCPF